MQHISNEDREALRAAAREYMELAAAQPRERLVRQWRALNSADMERPMVMIDQLPWHELNGGHELDCRVRDQFWRWMEGGLRMQIYKARHFPVDLVLEPWITIPKAISNPGFGFWSKENVLSTDETNSVKSHAYIPVLRDWDDIEKINIVKVTEDKEATKARMEAAQEIFDGVAPVVLSGGEGNAINGEIGFKIGGWDYLEGLLGVEESYLYVLDRPDFIHACVRRVTDSIISWIESANALEAFDSNSVNVHCTHTFVDGLLPDVGMGGPHVSQSCWAFGLAQLFSSVSPAIVEEFELPYVLEMAKYFGLVYYGCCDRLDNKLDVIKRIPNVRKLSCSPWSEREAFAEKIGRGYVMSNKPNPAYLAEAEVNWDVVRADLRRTIDAARRNGVSVELILKDISTVRYEPQRLEKWAEIAMELVNN